MGVLEQETAYEVTFIKPGEKLSVKLVPTTAEYVNEKTWVVMPQGGWSTRVSLTDIYALPSNGVPPTVQEQVNLVQKKLDRLFKIAETSY